MNNEHLQNLPEELHSLSKGVLQKIEKHDGEWSWYQLDRSLSFEENLPVINRLMEVLENLEINGLIRADSSKSTSNPNYWITEKGKGQ